MELIAVKNVSFSYGTAPVLEDITLSIYPGDFLAILGPNGSGKTTLLKIVLGLLKPTKGEVLIEGKPVHEFREREKIGYVPQKAVYIDSLLPASVREVVAMALFSKKKFPLLAKKKQESAIQEALHEVGMENFEDWQIGKLSGGQQQRVFIARALVHQPRLLILDEPTTGVDAETQEHFYEMLDTLNKKKKMTIVLVTHEISVVNRHVNQVACLNQRLVYHGSHQEFCSSEAFRRMLEKGAHIIDHKH